MEKIPYGRQNITEDDIQAVIEVLKSDWLTQGPDIKHFEDNFANYIGAKYAVAVSNGTAALHLCALALNIQPGDKVITTPITFVASANCVKYCGGEVVFSDIDPKTYLLDLDKVRLRLESAPKGTYKGIIPVQFAGRSVDMEAFRKLADEFGLWIIEDACHAPGGYFKDSSDKIQNCGNGIFADLAIFSFHPVKHIAAGEGGMITTNNETLYKHLLNLRSHGIQQDPAKKLENHGVWYYEMQELGYNYRLTDFQAALGNSQLLRAEAGLKRRREIAEIYQKAFVGKPYLLGQSGIIDGHAYHLYILEVKDRKALVEHLRAKNIFAQIHYIPAHLMPYYQQFGWKKGDLPNAEKYYENCISIPMFPTLTEIEQSFVVDTINKFYLA
ncbi:UDP-4-amino-4,6-dideoxy-N-acetyl-beta-L-altrosamine transaminase [Pedobacter changchengzhani]|uniref:UDP-4-amino-4, 6-dideoxy-N-acetyl-beta-L-altrosamine transaminase n=1 Tax=Pedobacter changchengzhani TaxID=2529274 RepID=A0A4R5MPY2_9SPHI|nr:UDP-4-amino-4,6-dideoxy-N-acetyl-beta-L-altrosamine transaminase [Pedobacter changchengzhani]TDG37696.1 UDP-4-amino-4,6-dideoxy-N-acetyl-beta-L-altrosamine transaminase [Pedobacter changchengzhani]